MKKSKGSISNVIDIEVLRFERFAKDFVDLYVEDGAEKAGTFAVLNMAKEKYSEASGYVQREFEDRGYTFSEPSSLE